MDIINLQGIRVHNLKNISLELPRNHLIVITGVSGSGKSSLAFDTIYAEGQRRYVESLSAYARQFLERMDKPDVDSISGIPPAIAIEQKNRVRNARSTVGTTTEIDDYLRLLFARIGTTYCERCRQPVRKDSVASIQDWLFSLPERTRFLVTFPLPQDFRGLEDLVSLKDTLIGKGFQRVLIGDDILELPSWEGLGVGSEERRFLNAQPTPSPSQEGNVRDILVVVDRLMLKQADRQRIADALETAYQEGNGRLAVCVLEEDTEQVTKPLRPLTFRRYRFSRAFECANCGIQYAEPEPRMFSFNNPFGACPECHGFGDKMTWNLDLIIPNWKKSIRDGAILPWNTPKSRGILRQLERIAPKYGFTLDTPIEQLTPPQRAFLIEGNAEFIGILPFFAMLEEQKYKMHVRVFMSKFRGYTTCPVCKGSRLKPAAGFVRIGGKTIYEVARMTVADACRFFATLPLSDFERGVAEKLLDELRNRLQYLLDVGLDYLTLNRLSRTLSGGEMQRIHLATSLGTSLVGSLYVLDEPSIGLHPRDNARLIELLKTLRDKGNTVIVVEHDLEMMRESDFLVDLGPQAGEQGGEVVFAGATRDLFTQSGVASLTGQYLRGEQAIPLPVSRRIPTEACLRLEGASEHNLKGIDATFPLGLFVCVTGVSGSGKSTLISDLLYPALKGERRPGNGFAALHGREQIADVILVDQSPIGRTPRSNPVTYMSAFDDIRKLFAATRLAQMRGYTAGTFSFNVAGGRCDVCEGNGLIEVDMQFLADVYLTCDACNGKRYKRDVLDVLWNGLTIHDALNLTVDDAVARFEGQRSLLNKLKTLQAVGLGYLRLGQPATTLSGGEAQRLKLAEQLADKRKQRTLYLFDEPTTGLHLADIARLLDCFRKLLDRGHSLIVIEHNLDVIKCADYLIDLGPDGGDRGGRIVAYGTPEAVAQVAASHTGRYLQAYSSQMRTKDLTLFHDQSL
ncbi:excinuclease ABC, protein A [Candidatus Moduliflexus flocculans]|uniref:UvrABC system protein A n=1 Tax=Candidatus Moduliflexus flocculans TaxID=1499966 RepID=A0A0S6VSM9_9BACT|nr:excinuclease ABC, protein A [Candidatus Moduliflexus flocculans]